MTDTQGLALADREGEATRTLCTASSGELTRCIDPPSPLQSVRPCCSYLWRARDLYETVSQGTRKQDLTYHCVSWDLVFSLVKWIGSRFLGRCGDEVHTPGAVHAMFLPLLAICLQLLGSCLRRGARAGACAVLWWAGGPASETCSVREVALSPSHRSGLSGGLNCTNSGL